MEDLKAVFLMTWLMCGIETAMSKEHVHCLNTGTVNDCTPCNNRRE